MNPGEIVLALSLQVVLIFLNAIFASAEIAVISANQTKMEKLAEDGNKRAKRICRLTKNSSKFLSTIQVAITLASLLGSAFAADSFSIWLRCFQKIYACVIKIYSSSGYTITKGGMEMIKTDKGKKRKELLTDAGFLLVSGFLFGMAYNMFLVPGEIFIGGAGGLAMEGPDGGDEPAAAGLEPGQLQGQRDGWRIIPPLNQADGLPGHARQLPQLRLVDPQPGAVFLQIIHQWQYQSASALSPDSQGLPAVHLQSL